MLKRSILYGLVLVFFCSNVFAVSRSSNEILDIETKGYYIDLSKENVTTNNIDYVFRNMKILKVYPSINLSVNDNRVIDSLSNISFFDTDSYVKNYINILNKYGFYDDSEKVIVSGVRIKKVYVESSKRMINDFILEHRNLKLSKND